MSVRTAVLRSLLVVVAGGFSTAGKITGGVASRTGDRDGETEPETGTTMTPPGPLGPPASAGRQAVLTGVGPGPEDERSD